MTDNTSAYAGTYEGGVRLVCLLNEGNITVADDAFTETGLKETVCSLASKIEKDEWVAIEADAACTYATTGGWPVVEKVANTVNLAMGKVVDTPRWKKIPSESHTSGLADRLDKGYYRYATVWFPTVTGVAEGIIDVDGSNAIAAGATTLGISATGSNGEDMVTVGYDADGSGLIALTYTVAGTDGDTYSILLGFTGGPVSVIA